MLSDVVISRIYKRSSHPTFSYEIGQARSVVIDVVVVQKGLLLLSENTKIAHVRTI